MDFLLPDSVTTRTATPPGIRDAGGIVPGADATTVDFGDALRAAGLRQGSGDDVVQNLPEGAPEDPANTAGAWGGALVPWSTIPMVAPVLTAGATEPAGGAAQARGPILPVAVPIGAALPEVTRHDLVTSGPVTASGFQGQSYDAAGGDRHRLPRAHQPSASFLDMVAAGMQGAPGIDPIASGARVPSAPVRAEAVTGAAPAADVDDRSEVFTSGTRHAMIRIGGDGDSPMLLDLRLDGRGGASLLVSAVEPALLDRVQRDAEDLRRDFAAMGLSLNVDIDRGAREHPSQTWSRDQFSGHSYPGVQAPAEAPVRQIFVPTSGALRLYA